jgi:hypothetical protein
MGEHKKDLAVMSVRQLLARRRGLAARLGDVQEVLAGSLTEQARRCGKAGCRCAGGEPHGPYSYFAPRDGGRGRLKYVPAGLAEVVRRYLQRGEAVEAVLAEISAVNAELLARRELG